MMTATQLLAEPITLLQTKLYPPQVDADLIDRPQLLDYLNQGLRRKLTLVAAPAGYGKTTLVHQWLTHLRLGVTAENKIANPKSKIQNRVAWLSLDEYDNDPPLFLRYLVAAVKTVYPTACDNTLALIQAAQQPPADYMATVFVNDLAVRNQDLILVLDDYHFIQEAYIHQFLARLLDHLPQRMHLVLITRLDPPGPIPIPRLRVRRQLSEVRAAALKFSPDESTALLRQSLGQTLTPETVAALQARTEGWVTGLQLAVLSLQDQVDQVAFRENLQGSNQYVLDYLLSEVLAHQPPVMQDFLLQTAVLDRLCAPLCEAVLGETWSAALAESPEIASLTSAPAPEISAGQAALTWLVQHNLFLVALDGEGQWYRYHHLFQELLRHHAQTLLSEECLAVLYRRASSWLTDNDFIEEALYYALAANETISAAQLIEQYRHDLLNRGDYSTLRRWIALLPADIVQQRPNLLLTKAWLAFSQNQIAAISPLIEKAVTCLADNNLALDEAARQRQQGEIYSLQCINWYWQHSDSQQSIACGEQALAAIPLTDILAYNLTIMTLANAYLLIGQPDKAKHLVQTSISQHEEITAVRLWLLRPLAFIYLISGDLPQSIQVSQNLLQLASANENELGVVFAHNLLSDLKYEWNALEEAAQHTLAAISQVEYYSFRVAHDSYLRLALIYQMQGQPDQAQETVERLLKLVLSWENNHLLNEIQSFQAYLWLLQGQVEKATHQLATVNTKTTLGLMYAPEIPALTQAKILIAQSTVTSLAEAKGILSEVWSVAERSRNIRRMIELLALEALIYQAQGQVDKAMAALERSVTLAKPGRFIRTFVDLGPPMASLLYQLAERGLETDYLGQVLAAFPETLANDRPTQQIQAATEAQLIEPLTQRESEVLLHLHQGHANKIIAQALDISLWTVKKHTTNIFQKLGVKGRKQAVARARALGILPDG